MATASVTTLRWLVPMMMVLSLAISPCRAQIIIDSEMTLSIDGNGAATYAGYNDRCSSTNPDERGCDGWQREEEDGGRGKSGPGGVRQIGF
jgi:hypothetical protein